MGFRVQLIAVTGKEPSAIQRLVGARCKQASMRNWTRYGAEGMLRLRAALQTGAYHNVWTHPKETAAWIPRHNPSSAPSRIAGLGRGA